MSALIKSMDEMSANGREEGVTRKGEQPKEVGAVVPLLLTIPQAAQALAVGRTTVYELIAGGAIEVVHIGRCARIPVEAVRSFVEHQRAHR